MPKIHHGFTSPVPNLPDYFWPSNLFFSQAIRNYLCNLSKLMVLMEVIFSLVLPIHLCVLPVYTECFPKFCEQNHRHITRVGFGPTNFAILKQRLWLWLMMVMMMMIKRMIVDEDNPTRTWQGWLCSSHTHRVGKMIVPFLTLVVKKKRGDKLIMTQDMW